MILDSRPPLALQRAMAKPAPTELVPPQWKRNPFALWVYIAAGVVMILLSGARIVLDRVGVRR